MNTCTLAWHLVGLGDFLTSCVWSMDRMDRIYQYLISSSILSKDKAHHVSYYLCVVRFLLDDMFVKSCDTLLYDSQTYSLWQSSAHRLVSYSCAILDNATEGTLPLLAGWYSVKMHQTELRIETNGQPQEHDANDCKLISIDMAWHCNRQTNLI